MLRQLEKTSHSLINGLDLPIIDFEEPPFTMEYQGFVQAKERPRKGRGGNHHYTPPATRLFEENVAEEALKRRQELRMEFPFRRPVKMNVTIYDEFPKDWLSWHKRLALSGYLYPTAHGDLDNKVKAIWDALNKIAYEDDRFIVQCDKQRKYWHYEGFRVEVLPVGLKVREIEILAKLMK